MKTSTRCVVTGAEKGACVGAALVVLAGAVVLAVAVLGPNTVDLGLFRAQFDDAGRELSASLQASWLLWLVPLAGAAVGGFLARRTA
ncbi:hypothetical protein [Nocardioides yefusunii]|uniref:Uncharacterized protein n=1 Tax=Nocardioides yefusunii TaxID=2500546 RepID=A0ABW1QYC0_9ACTN|nr:hypothetical protein [Nocardioides yefusunii]